MNKSLYSIHVQELEYQKIGKAEREQEEGKGGRNIFIIYEKMSNGTSFSLMKNALVVNLVNLALNLWSLLSLYLHVIDNIPGLNFGLCRDSSHWRWLCFQWGICRDSWSLQCNSPKVSVSCISDTQRSYGTCYCSLGQVGESHRLTGWWGRQQLQERWPSALACCSTWPSIQKHHTFPVCE